MEVIIQQQSEQIRAQQLQTESMNMQVKKLMDSIRPYNRSHCSDCHYGRPAASRGELHRWQGLHQPVLISQKYRVPRSQFLFLVHGSLWEMMVYLDFLQLPMEPKSLD